MMKLKKKKLNLLMVSNMFIKLNWFFIFVRCYSLFIFVIYMYNGL